MPTDPQTPDRHPEESHITLRSPPASPKHILLPHPAFSKSEHTTQSAFVGWKAQDSLMVEAKSEAPETLLSPASKLYQPPQNAPPTPEDSTMKCDSMSPSDSYSVLSSPQTFGWPSSSESGESEPWMLRQDLLPDQSPYAHSPPSPAGGWDCSVSYQFQSAPTSAGYYQDCSLPFPGTSTSSPMQANYSPNFELASTYSSPPYPTSHFDEASNILQRSLPMGMPERGDFGSDIASHHDYSPVAKAPTSDCYSDIDRAGTPEAHSLKDDDVNSMPYSQLLYRAFMSSKTRRLQLKQIYDWFLKNTNKAESKGWQNSIRHNLSMNQAFRKAELKDDGTESRRSTEWVLQDWAVVRGVQSTTRYRKAISRAKTSGMPRGRIPDMAYSASRRALSGCGSRARERLYTQRMQLHGLPTSSHMLYGPSISPQHATATMSDTGGYMGPPGGVEYSPAQLQEGCNGFVSEGSVAGSDNYPMYLGEGNMGEYVIAGGVPDGTLAGVQAGVVVPPSPSMGVSYGQHFPSTVSEQMHGSQQRHTYTPIEYNSRQGVSTGADEVCEWRGD